MKKQQTGYFWELRNKNVFIVWYGSSVCQYYVYYSFYYDWTLFGIDCCTASKLKSHQMICGYV